MSCSLRATLERVLFGVIRYFNKLPAPTDLHALFYENPRRIMMMRGSPEIHIVPIPSTRELVNYQSMFQTHFLTRMISMFKVMWSTRMDHRLDSLPDQMFVELFCIGRHKFVTIDNVVDFSYLSSREYYMTDTMPACGTKITFDQAKTCSKIEMHPCDGSPYTVLPTDTLWPTAKWWALHNMALHTTWIEHVMLHRSLFSVCYALRQVPEDQVLFHLLAPHTRETVAFHNDSYQITSNPGHPLTAHSLPIPSRYGKIHQLEKTLDVHNPWQVPDVGSVHPNEHFPNLVEAYQDAVRLFVRVFVTRNLQVLQGTSTKTFLEALCVSRPMYRQVYARHADVPSLNEWVEMLTIFITSASFGHCIVHNVTTSQLSQLGGAHKYLPFRARVVPPQHINDHRGLGESFNWWIDRFQAAMFTSASFVTGTATDIYSDMNYRCLHGDDDVRLANEAMIETCRRLDLENSKTYSHWNMMSSIRN
jgi:hypothetical protein